MNEIPFEDKLENEKSGEDNQEEETNQQKEYENSEESVDFEELLPTGEPVIIESEAVVSPLPAEASQVLAESTVSQSVESAFTALAAGVINGSFEDTEIAEGSGWQENRQPVGWTFKNPNDGVASLSTEPGTFVEGTQSAKLTYTNSDKPRFIQFVTPEGGVQEGHEYELTFWMKNDVSVYVAFQQAYTVAPEKMAAWTPKEIAADGTGKYYSVQLTGLAGIEAFKLIFYPHPNAKTGTFYVDDVQVKDKSREQTPLETLRFSDDKITLYVGETYTPELLYTPEETDDKEVSYRVEDPEIVSMNEKGEITALKSGMTKLVAASLGSPQITAELLITVIGNAVVNGGFEESEIVAGSGWQENRQPIGWTLKNASANGVGSLSQEPGTFIEGNQSAKLTYTNTTSPRFIQFVTPEGGVQEGHEYELTFWMKNDVKVNVAFQQAYTVSPEKMADWTPTEITANETGKYYSIPLTGLAGIEAFKLIFYPHPDAKTGTFYVDDVRIAEKLNVGKLEKLSFAEASLTLKKGQSTLPVLQYAPQNAVNKEVDFTIADETIASVDQSGRVTALAQGKTTLTAIGKENPSITATLPIQVTDSAVVNGGFEETIITSGSGWKDDLQAVGWTMKNASANGVGSLSQEPGTFIEGNQSAKLTYTNTTSPRFIQFVTPEGGVQEGHEYELSFWMKNDAKVNVAFQQAYTVSPEKMADWTPTEIAANEAGKYYSIKLNGLAGIEAFKIIFYPNANTGTFYLDDVQIKENIITLEGLEFPQERITLQLNQPQEIPLRYLPSNASDKAVTVKIANESIAKVKDDGEITGLKTGETLIQVISKNHPEISAEAQLRVIDGFAIDCGSLHLSQGRRLLLHCLNAEDDLVEWTSSNPDIAFIHNGFLFAEQAGIVEISAEYEGMRDQITLTIEPVVADKYDQMRHNYAELIGDLDPDYTDPNTQAYMSRLFDQAKEYWDLMKPNLNEDGSKKLWPDEYTGGVASKPYLRNIYFLKIMAQAFLTEGSPYQYDRDLYQDIMSAIEWWTNYVYTGPQGTPKPKYVIEGGMGPEIEGGAQLNNFVTLMYDFLTQEQIEKYAGRVNIFIPDPAKNAQQGGANMTGSNRLDFCKNHMVANVILKDEAKIQESMSKAFAASGKVIEIVKSGDGFYYDGSTVFHTNKAYTSGYGRALIAASGYYLHVLNGIEDYQSFVEEKVDLLSEVIEVNYVPVVWQGLLSDVTAGRGISRQLQSQEVRGLSFINGMTLIARMAKEDQRIQLQGHLKYWIQENPRIVTNLLDPTSKEPNYPFVKFYHEVMADETVTPIRITEQTYAMNRMAKFFHNREDYSFQISMYNQRISNTEVGNNENMKGFHLGDGWTVLNNSDLHQYLDDTWATIDWKRIPGTTVDTLSIDKLLNLGDTTSKENWVGGSVIDERYGAAGMILNKSNSIPGSKGIQMDLTARKSWFTFDHEIVALGSGITSSQGRSVETIVENRKITQDNRLVIDGREIAQGEGALIDQPRYAHLSGSTPGSDLGYYFPSPAAVHIQKQEHSGYWKDINAMKNGFTVDETLKTDDYATLWFDHGVDPQQAQYAYVILPCASEAETKAYAENPQIEIIAQTSDVHAVYHHGLNILAINNFSETPVTVNGVTVDKAGSVMIRFYDDGTIRIAAMSPYNDASHETLTVTLDRPLIEVLHQDANVKNTVFADGQFTAQFQTRDNDKPQNTWLLQIRSEADKRELKLEIAKTEGLNAGNYTRASWNSLQEALAEAETIFADRAASQTQVDSVVKRLITAVRQLVKAPAQPDTDTSGSASEIHPEPIQTKQPENARLTQSGTLSTDKNAHENEKPDQLATAVPEPSPETRPDISTPEETPKSEAAEKTTGALAIVNLVMMILTVLAAVLVYLKRKPKTAAGYRWAGLAIAGLSIAIFFITERFGSWTFVDSWTWLMLLPAVLSAGLLWSVRSNGRDRE
ncbi:polysaccharide lyase family 8 super-sandwich domain-containing protein [Holdemania filiformis]|nr:polysaccharide lyase family 8 super-sandwich domain-containing protein [Holdemania filiformis]